MKSRNKIDVLGRLYENKKKADQQWDEVKTDPRYIGAAMALCNSIDKKILEEEQRLREKKIRKDHPDYDPLHPENVRAEEIRNEMIYVLEQETGMNLDRILVRKQFKTKRGINE